MKQLRFGIIGIGNIAPVHAKAIKSIPDAELVAVAECDSERAQKFVAEHGCGCHEDYRELIARPDIDVVTICTPHHLHAPMTIQAAQAGKHVLCEKPMAKNVAECDAMIKACAQAGVTLGIVSQSRFEKLSRLTKALVDEGKLGRLLWSSSSTTWFRSKEYYGNSSWRGTWAHEGGGVLINQAIHVIDAMLWIGGMPKRIAAQTRTLNHPIEVEDVAVATLEFADGHIGLIQATTNAYPGYPEKLEFFGTNGSAVYHKGEARLEWHLMEPREDGQDQDQVSSGAAAPMDINASGHIAQFNEYADAIRNHRAPFVGGRDGRNSIAVIEAIYRSAREHAPVEL